MTVSLLLLHILALEEVVRLKCAIQSWRLVVLMSEAPVLLDSLMVVLFDCVGGQRDVSLDSSDESVDFRFDVERFNV